VFALASNDRTGAARMLANVLGSDAQAFTAT